MISKGLNIVTQSHRHRLHRQLDEQADEEECPSHTVGSTAVRSHTFHKCITGHTLAFVEKKIGRAIPSKLATDCVWEWNWGRWELGEEYWLFIMLFIVSKFHFCNLKIKKHRRKHLETWGYKAFSSPQKMANALRVWFRDTKLGYSPSSFGFPSENSTSHPTTFILPWFFHIACKKLIC